MSDVPGIGAPALRWADALIQGKPGVLLSLSSQFGANTLETTHAVEAALAALVRSCRPTALKSIPPCTGRELHRTGITNIQTSLTIAAVLILLVLFASCAIGVRPEFPSSRSRFSLVAAAVVLGRAGEDLNTMTLGGFAVALGVLVDDAIIGIENILRRLRSTAQDPELCRASTCFATPDRDPGTGALRDACCSWSP